MILHDVSANTDANVYIRIMCVCVCVEFQYYLYTYWSGNPFKSLKGHDWHRLMGKTVRLSNVL